MAWNGKEGRGSKDGRKGGCGRRRSRRNDVNQIEDVVEKRRIQDLNIEGAPLLRC